MAAMKEKAVEKTLLSDEFEPHPIREGRKIPVSRISRRIDVLRYDRDAPLKSEPLKVERVRIPLNQNVGVPCEPLVKRGDRVEEGMMIGSPPDGALGAPIHASISGVVEHIFNDSIFIRAR